MFPKILTFVGPLGEKFIFLFSLEIPFVLSDQGLFVNIQTLLLKTFQSFLF